MCGNERALREVRVIPYDPAWPQQFREEAKRLQAIFGLEALGYEPMGEFGLPGRRYFRKGGRRRTHHVHVYAADNPEIYGHLAFRDYLRANPDVAQEYATLKQELARQFPYDIESYMDGKNDFVKDTEHAAMMWWWRVPVIILSGPVGEGLKPCITVNRRLREQPFSEATGRSHSGQSGGQVKQQHMRFHRI